MKIFIKENINDIEISKSKWLSHFHEAYDFKLDNSKLSIGKYNPTNNWSVVELFVEDEDRRKGYATKLLKKAIEFLNGQKLIAQVSNYPSLMLHYKLGFRTYKDGEELSIEQTEAIRQKNSSVKMEIN